MAIAHFTLATRDVERAARFFLDVLGWKAINRPGNIHAAAAWLRIAPDQELHLIEVADFEVSPFEREYGRHFALTFPLEEFSRIKERLAVWGSEVIAEERVTPFERFFFKDPDGYMFEVIDAAHEPEA